MDINLLYLCSGRLTTISRETYASVACSEQY